MTDDYPVTPETVSAARAEQEHQRQLFEAANPGWHVRRTDGAVVRASKDPLFDLAAGLARDFARKLGMPS